MDSGSDDGTVELLRSQADRLIEIRAERVQPRDDAQCRAWRRAGAPLVVLLVQDAEPASADWLAQAGGAAAGRSMPARRAVRRAPLAGHLCPPGSASRRFGGGARISLAILRPPAPLPAAQTIADQAEFDALSPAERLAACTFDNVCSCIRREVWERHPFRPAADRRGPGVGQGRDAGRLRSGLRARTPPSCTRTIGRRRYELRRTYLVHQQLRRLFGLATVPTRRAPRPRHRRFGRRAREVDAGRPGQRRRQAVASCRGRWPWPWRMPLGQYLGARSADAGRELLRVRGV
ncbi:MAG: hypothetical protein MZV65_39850 [Chromatiales bacterium]|nr:hypothetical protein [Chromatiales bacterium]